MNLGGSRHLPDDGELNARILAIQREMASDMVEMEAALGATIALGRDARFQSLLRPAGHDGPFAASLPREWTWIELGGDHHGELHRTAPPGMPHVSFDGAAAADPHIRDELAKAVKRTRSYLDAEHAVRQFIVPLRLPDRKAASRLLSWSSVVDIIAYRIATRTITVLEAIRPIIIARGFTADPVAHAIRRKYWQFAELMARTILLGADRGAARWLNGMADSFVWEEWTPSRALVRERSLWLTAIGARSASAFGAPIIDRYADRLGRMHHPVEILDCLVGLVSVGLAEPDARRDVVKRLERAQASLSSRELIMPEFAYAAVAQAIWMLNHGDLASQEGERLFLSSQEPRSPFGIEGVLQTDPTNADHNGRIFGLSILPIAIAQPREEFFPRLKPRRDHYAGLADDDIFRLISDAWIGMSPRETLQ